MRTGWYEAADEQAIHEALTHPRFSHYSDAVKVAPLKTKPENTHAGVLGLNLS